MDSLIDRDAEDIEVLEDSSHIGSHKNDESHSNEIQNEKSVAPKPVSNDTEVINLDDYEDITVLSDKDKDCEEPVTLNPTRKQSQESTTEKETPYNLRDETRSSVWETEVEVHENDDSMLYDENKTKESTSENDKKELSTLVDNQVQCVNLHCQSGFELSEAPVFVLTYFGVPRRKNVLQKVCRDCFDIALKHQKKMCRLLFNKVPLMAAEFPSQKDDVVVMDSVEEIYEEEVLPRSIISMVENDLLDLMKNAISKYNLNFQIQKSEEILTEKYENLTKCNKEINDELTSLEKQLVETRKLIYQDFTPKIKSLPPLNISESDQLCEPKKPIQPVKPRPVATKKVTHIPLPPPIQDNFNSNQESQDIVALKEVEVLQVKLPPVGPLVPPLIYVGNQVYVMKVSFFGVWVKAKVTEIISRAPENPSIYRVRFESTSHGGYYKVICGKQMAYSKPSSVRYPVGTRVIALFRNSESPGKDAYYAGVIAEPPKILNIFRYLVFFDDGYAQYVSHDKILLVCESSKHVYEDIHPDSRDFIKNYLEQYPERPMVKLQKGQIVKTEWNGKWWVARVMAIDGSLVKMHFDADNRTEWIYRGSTRLGPLYSELVAAAARKEQGALSRHRSLGIASLKKRNMPYVEYSVDQDDTKSSQPPTTVSKNVAKKSTASKANSQDNSSDRAVGPPNPDEKLEYTTKGYIRTVKLTGRIKARTFAPHQCGSACVEWTNYQRSDCRGINPLAIPLFFGFERQRLRVKGKKSIMYRGPCGRRLRNILEMHRYLRLTKSKMGLDLFDFDYAVRALDEFHLEPNMYCTHIKDISYGRENTPVSCVNEINHSWPSFMNYSVSRIPQEGVNICLDEEFLVCCDCTDDCQDKEKCECWQLTLEGAKRTPEYVSGQNIGYQFKRLLEPVVTGIYECNQRCKCASTCLNRVAQHPLQLNLQVFRTLKKGWGLRTLNDIPHGGFICIYAGRLHTEQSANDDGRMYGDEYLAELDYIEVVERFKEGYESDVMDPEGGKNSVEEDREEESDGDEGAEQDEIDENQTNNDDIDYVPQGLNRLPKTESIVNTRGRNKKINSKEQQESEKDVQKEENSKSSVKKPNEEKSVNEQNQVKEKKIESEQSKEPEENAESEREKEKEEKPEGFNTDEDDDDEMKKRPSKFTADVLVEDEKSLTYKSVRVMYGDGADDCYVMDAKSSGNIGRYLNHSCQPNVFVQNVFVDTHDVRFPWVAFFALSHIKAGTELTWDYNYDVGSVAGKVLYCYCNSAECRGRLL